MPARGRTPEDLYPTCFKHERLEVHHLALGEVYRLSEAFPKSEQFGPLRSAATSVALNVAEDKGRESDRDLAKFLYRSSGSRLEPDLGEGV